jgi:hypothetical protein
MFRADDSPPNRSGEGRNREASTAGASVSMESWLTRAFATAGCEFDFAQIKCIVAATHASPSKQELQVA